MTTLKVFYTFDLSLTLNTKMMKVSSWLKSGRKSKKMDNAVLNIHCNPAGSIGEASWSDYVQISIYSKEKGRFIRLEMTLDEARKFQEDINKRMEIFNSCSM